MKNFETRFEVYKNKNKNMNVEKFPHLNETKPKIGKILDMPIWLVNTEHLWQLWKHFQWIQQKYSFDKDVVSAAGEIINKIDKIIWFWENKISWEIMASTADDYYLEYKKTA